MVIRDWWKYAIQMIVAQIRNIKNNRINIFNISKILISEYRKDFEKLYKKYYLIYNENKKTETITEEENYIIIKFYEFP